MIALTHTNSSKDRWSKPVILPAQPGIEIQRVKSFFFFLFKQVDGCLIPCDINNLTCIRIHLCFPNKIPCWVISFFKHSLEKNSRPILLGNIYGYIFWIYYGCISQFPLTKLCCRTTIMKVASPHDVNQEALFMHSANINVFVEGLIWIRKSDLIYTRWNCWFSGYRA